MATSPRTSQPLKVVISDLGLIGKAEVRLSPMTLFVGENNSGKSYLATLLWALHQAPTSIFDPAADDKVRQFVDHVRERAKDIASVSADTFPNPERVVAAIAGEDSLDSLDGAERFSPPADQELQARALRRLVHLAFRTDSVNPSVALAFQEGEAFASFGTRNSAGKGASWGWEATGDGNFFMSFGGDLESNAQRVALRLLLWRTGLPAGRELGDITEPAARALYFPASRTGFMHVLPELIDRLLSRSAGSGQGDSDFLPGVTAPTIQFLRFLAMASLTPRRPSRHQDLVDLIEQSVLRGRLQDAGQRGSLNFSPTGSELSLPIGRASAVVSELAPLIMLLKDGDRYPGLLVYEEPEAHLHPRLQRVVAQVLVRLVRRGTHVLVTSHSETFLQQINTFIKMDGIDPEKRRELSVLYAPTEYGDEDFLSASEVAAYGFSCSPEGVSQVVELGVDEWGVTAPTFNTELTRLVNETLAVDQLRSAQGGGQDEP